MRIESDSMSQAWPEPQDEAFHLKDRYEMTELLRLMAFLRSPQGCPWDRVQTHITLRSHLLEEAYESVDAIDSGDPERMCDELGDLLMQIVFHAQLGAEQGTFDFTDIVTGLCRKLISRHSHLFGTDQADTPASVVENWEKNKRQEKGLISASAVLADVPRSLPALQRGAKITQKAAQVGFDWPDGAGPRAKIDEELHELDQADGQASREEELGDLLFAVVNLARHWKVAPELALNRSTEKFIRRFSAMEQRVLASGRSLENLTLAEMDQIWDQVKAEEGNVKHASR